MLVPSPASGFPALWSCIALSRRYDQATDPDVLRWGHDAVRAHLLALTIDSHRQFGRLTHEDALTSQVVAGKHVWHRKDCINCHTLLGEGAYYAPDLTKIAQLRGENRTCVSS